MKLKDVPEAAAYLVFHDAFDNGAMDVRPAESFESAEVIAARRNEHLAQAGNDDCGIWRAYQKLPRKRIWKYSPEVAK